jgi:hypothetical protein
VGFALNFKEADHKALLSVLRSSFCQTNYPDRFNSANRWLIFISYFLHVVVPQNARRAARRGVSACLAAMDCENDPKMRRADWNTLVQWTYKVQQK